MRSSSNTVVKILQPLKYPFNHLHEGAEFEIAVCIWTHPQLKTCIKLVIYETDMEFKEFIIEKSMIQELEKIDFEEV